VVIKQLLVLTNVSVISFLGFFKQVNVLFEFFLRRESDSIDSLQTVIGSLTQPIS